MRPQTDGVEARVRRVGELVEPVVADERADDGAACERGEEDERERDERRHGSAIGQEAAERQPPRVAWGGARRVEFDGRHGGDYRRHIGMRLISGPPVRAIAAAGAEVEERCQPRSTSDPPPDDVTPPLRHPRRCPCLHGAACRRRGRGGTHVTIVSDSVLTAVTWGNVPAQAALDQNLDVQVDAGVCRRLNVQSCQFNGAYAPTALDVLYGWRTSLGPVVVIVDGYNDIPSSFASDVELTLDTLRNDGVQHVLWLNLHAVRPEYAQKNAVLAAAALQHPELRVLDWNAYSSGHPEWYQTDYIHLVPAGGVAIAAFIHQAILDALAPSAPTPQPSRRRSCRRSSSR